jgi:hypothetical protein
MTPAVARAIEAIRATAQRGMTIVEPGRELPSPPPLEPPVFRGPRRNLSVASRLRQELFRVRGQWVWAADLARRLEIDVNGIIPSLAPWVRKGVVETSQGDRDYVSGKIKRLYRIPPATGMPDAGAPDVAISRRNGVARRLRQELLRADGEWVWAADLARRLEVPSRMVVPLLSPWVRKGVVKSKRGDIDAASGKAKRMFRIPLVAAALAVFCCGGAQAQQMQCGPLTNLRAALAERFKEQPVSAGLQSDGRLFEVFASPDTGTWTAVTTSPAGIACIVATGKSWQQGATGEPS